MNEKNTYEEAVNMLSEIAGNKQFLNSKLQLRLPYDKNAKKIFSSGRIHQDVFWFNVYGFKGSFPEFLKKVIIWTETPAKTGTEKTLINPEYIKLITNKQTICEMMKLNNSAANNEEYKKKLNNIDIKIAELNSALSETEKIKKNGFKYAMMVLKIFFKGYETHPRFWPYELSYEQKTAQTLMSIFKNKAEVHYVYVIDNSIVDIGVVGQKQEQEQQEQQNNDREKWTQELEDTWRSKLDDDSVFVPKSIRDIFIEYDSNKLNNLISGVDNTENNKWTPELELIWRDKINNNDFVPQIILSIFKEHDERTEYIKRNENNEYVKPQVIPGIIKLLSSENYKIETSKTVTNIYVNNCIAFDNYDDYNIIMNELDDAGMAGCEENVWYEDDSSEDEYDIHAPVIMTDDTIVDFYDSVYIGHCIGGDTEEYSFYESCINIERPHVKTVYVTLLSNAKELELKIEREEREKEEREKLEEREKEEREKLEEHEKLKHEKLEHEKLEHEKLEEQ